MQKGFTLIEMLIVIAIIGLLSSVVLTALGPARSSARDARIVQEVNQTRAIAETLYENYTYNKLPVVSGADAVETIDNQEIKGLAKDILSLGGELVVRRTTGPNGGYVIYSKVNAKAGDAQNPLTNFYCTDSRGSTGYTTNEPVISMRCF